jgi:hypothetical protein
MKPEEVLGIFEKWASEEIDVLCFSRFHGWGFNLLSRVVPFPTLSETVFKAGESAWLKLNLAMSDMIFEYREPRSLEATHPELIADWPPELRELSFLSVSFPLRLPPGGKLSPLRDQLFFLELPPEIDTSPPSR